MAFTAVAAAAVGSAAISSDASKSAAKKQRLATEEANATQKQVYNQTQADNAPWKDVGSQALSQMSKLYGIQVHDINGNVTGGAATAGTADMSGFTTSPDYQFRLDEGNRNINAGYAAKGALQSGAAQKAILKYGQDQASSEYGNYFNRLASMAGYGQQAIKDDTSAGQHYADETGRNTINQGKVEAGSVIEQGNAWNSALRSVTGALSGGGGMSSFGQGSALTSGSPSSYNLYGNQVKPLGGDMSTFKYSPALTGKSNPFAAL